MSDETEKVGEPSLSLDSFLDRLEDWYQVPALALLAAFMLWVRAHNYENFLVNGEVLFSGNDAWYHYRQIVYTAENWPRVMPFDPWTYFPHGTAVGQFGTLYDQLIATAALVIGLGSPSEQTVAMTTLFAPAVFGTLVVLPTYFIAKRLRGRFAGVFAALVLALIPGLFLSRGLVGAADHNIAEPLFQSTAVLATMVALAVAERDRPVWEQVRGREFASLRAPLGWSVLAGVATALYMWMWPPGVLLVGILGVFYVVKLSADYVRGVSPDHVAFVGATSMLVTAVMMLVPFSSTGFSTTLFSVLQPGMALAVAFGAAFMAWLAREWEARDVDDSLYPIAVAGVIALGLAALWLVLPAVFDNLVNNLIRFIGFGANAQQRTIAEAKPWLFRTTLFPAVFGQYGLTFFTAVAGALMLLFQSIRRERNAEYVLVLVWAAFITSAAFTQVRFNYYLAVPVAVLTGYFVSLVFAEFVPAKTASDVDATHVFVALAVGLVVLAPLVAGVNAGSAQVPTPVQVGNSAGPGGVAGWSDTLDWMAENTPEEGTYGGADNAGELDYYGTYAQRDDFDYPAGAYGVMSWWDYGHWITVESRRIPDANPFQQGAGVAADYLLAGNASQAEDVLQNVDEDDAKTRYVVLDWQMVRPSVTTYQLLFGSRPISVPAGKFNAPLQFDSYENLNAGDMYSIVWNTQVGQQALPWAAVKSQRYYESQMVRLYRFHGSAVEPRPLVVDWDISQGGARIVPEGENASFVRQFDTMEEARAYVQQDGTAQLGGRNGVPSEYVPALQHYRLVKADASGVPLQLRLGGSFGGVPSYTKLFERVPGATLEGEGPANTTVTARVNMSVPSQNATFVYTQRAQTGSDGSFTMTLPYSTTGYENWGTEEGYTNVSVRANTPYLLTTPVSSDNGTATRYSATVNVSEGKVVGEDASPVEATLERETASQGSGNESGGESGNGSADGANSSSVRPPPSAGVDGATGADGTAAGSPTVARPGVDALG